MKHFLLLVTALFGMSANAAKGSSTGIVTWFDIRVAESSKAEAFYGPLFDWEFQEIFPGYKMILKNGVGVGGLSEEPARHRGKQGTMIYFKVEDLKRAHSAALSLGGRTEQPPMNIPGFGAYAIIRDFDENQIALFSDLPI